MNSAAMNSGGWFLIAVVLLLLETRFFEWILEAADGEKGNQAGIHIDQD